AGHFIVVRPSVFLAGGGWKVEVGTRCRFRFVRGHGPIPFFFSGWLGSLFPFLPKRFPPSPSPPFPENAGSARYVENPPANERYDTAQNAGQPIFLVACFKPVTAEKVATR